MRAIGEVRTRRGAWVLLVGVALLFALIGAVSSDQPIDAAQRSSNGVQATIADDLPPGVVPEANSITIVWLTFALAACALLSGVRRRAQAERGRAPPSLALPA
jgi:hypothetical protein